jgi:hypothetical protein
MPGSERLILGARLEANFGTGKVPHFQMQHKGTSLLSLSLQKALATITSERLSFSWSTLTVVQVSKCSSTL